MTNTVTLDAKLDLSAASDLLSALKAQDADEVVLDFHDVTHLGALCLQVILSAAKTTAAQKRTMSFVNISDRVVDQMRVMGITPEAIARGVQ